MNNESKLREKFRSALCEVIPTVCEDSGQAEWSQRELDIAFDVLYPIFKASLATTPLVSDVERLRECKNCGSLESSHPIPAYQSGFKGCAKFVGEATTPIEDGRSYQEIANKIISDAKVFGCDWEEWLPETIMQALSLKDSTHALEKEAIHKKHSVTEARLFAEKKVLEATITSLEDDRTDQELKISDLTDMKEGLEREVAELKGIRTNAIKFLDTELCDAHFQESKSQPFDDFHKAQKDAGCRMCLKSKLASQSSQIKKLEEAIEPFVREAEYHIETAKWRKPGNISVAICNNCGDLWPCDFKKAKEALARFKEGSSHGQ